MDTLLEHAILYGGDYRLMGHTAEEEFPYDRHYHDFYEIQFFPHASGVLEILKNEYPVKKYDVALINLFTAHSFHRYPDNDTVRYSLSLNPELLLEMCSERSNPLVMFDESNENYPLRNMGREDFQQCMQIIQSYQSIDMAYGADVMARALMFRLMAHLYNYFYSDMKFNVSVQTAVTAVIRTVRYIDCHLHDNITLDALAEQIGYNKFYIGRTFKKIAGYSLGEFIVSKRLERSVQLLRTNETMREISLKSGFKNYSYFYKAFKRLYGVGPTEYRSGLESERRQD